MNGVSKFDAVAIVLDLEPCLEDGRESHVPLSGESALIASSQRMGIPV